jgi:hypothetical protein
MNRMLVYVNMLTNASTSQSNLEWPVLAKAARRLKVTL